MPREKDSPRPDRLSLARAYIINVCDNNYTLGQTFIFTRIPIDIKPRNKVINFVEQSY